MRGIMAKVSSRVATNTAVQIHHVKRDRSDATILFWAPKSSETNPALIRGDIWALNSIRQ